MADSMTLQVEMPELYKAMCALVDGLAEYEKTLDPVGMTVFTNYTNGPLRRVARALGAEGVDPG